MTEEITSLTKPTRCWPWLALILILLLPLIVRIRLLDVPLERDEGEYAYAGQLLLQGIPPYKLAYNMKLPGIYAAYALIIAIFGQTHTAIHFGLLPINVATAVMLFLLGRKLFDDLTGLAAAGAFAFLSLSPKVQGFFANAEHFVIFFAMAGLLLLLYADRKRKLITVFAAALLLGIAFLMKQHGIFFMALGGLYLLITELKAQTRKWSVISLRLAVFALGLIIPFIITCLLLLRAGVFDNFWFWTFTYAGTYVSKVPLKLAPSILAHKGLPIVAAGLLFWLFALGGLLTIWRRGTASNRLFALGLLLFSFLAICPGFFFRPHYFILLLPAAGLFAGIGFASAVGYCMYKRPRYTAIALTVVLGLLPVIHTVYKQQDIFLRLTPHLVARSVYGANPFPEALEIGHFIRANSAPDETIAVIGSEPQIYFYAQRHSATSYIYTYELMQDHEHAPEMRAEMIQQIQDSKPSFFVFVAPHIRSSWVTRPTSDTTVLDWFKQYSRQHYNPVGLIEIVSEAETRYAWKKELVDFTPQSAAWLMVLQRIPPAPAGPLSESAPETP